MKKLNGDVITPVRVPKGWTHYVTAENGYVHVVYNIKNIAVKITGYVAVTGLCAMLFKGCCVVTDKMERLDYIDSGYSYSEKWDTWYRDDYKSVWDDAFGHYISDVDPWEYEQRGFRYSAKWDMWYKPARKGVTGEYEYWDDEIGCYVVQ